MKFKKILFGVTGAVALSFMLASCGNNDTTKNGSTNTTTKVVDTTTNSGDVVINYLSFINDNMIRVDIMNDLGVTFKYGEETVTSQGSLALNENSKLSYTGELTDVSKVNVVLVMDNETGATVSVNQGVTSSRFLELLGRLPISGSKKVYVAISTGTPTWTKGLNAAMDTAIEGYITTK